MNEKQHLEEVNIRGKLADHPPPACPACGLPLKHGERWCEAHR